jgi:hypothetical protein
MFSKTPAQLYWAVLISFLSLPSSLEDNKLAAISVAHNGSYTVSIRVTVLHNLEV